MGRDRAGELGATTPAELSLGSEAAFVELRTGAEMALTKLAGCGGDTRGDGIKRALLRCWTGKTSGPPLLSSSSEGGQSWVPPVMGVQFDDPNAQFDTVRAQFDGN